MARVEVGSWVMYYGSGLDGIPGCGFSCTYIGINLSYLAAQTFKRDLKQS